MPEMSPIKILMICRREATDTPLSGVEYHRAIIPHFRLNDDPGFNVDRAVNIDGATDEFLKDYPIIYFNSQSITADPIALFKRLKSLDIKVVFDIDDYWILPHNHIFYHDHQRTGTTKRVIELIKLADHVTTTTSFLADHLQYFNQNVTVIQNAIDPQQPQFIPEPTESDKLRFGYIGSITHIPDVKLMEPGFKQLNSDKTLSGKYDLFVQGFRRIEEQGIYREYEDIFCTGGGSIQKIFAADVNSYAQGYNLFDVALAPLENSVFNNCKSELKMIEAAFMNKAIIVSRVKPYTNIINHGVNCLAPVQSATGKEWYIAMKKLINNPAMVEDLANQLHEDVKDKYHIDTANQIRKELYKRLAE